MILLDEPAAGLVGTEIDSLAELLGHLRELGYTLVVVDHHMELVMRVADRVVVLNFGRVIASGSPEEVAGDPSVIRAYLGSVATAGQSSRLTASELGAGTPR